MVAPDGEVMTEAGAEGPAVIVAEVDAQKARAKRVIKVPGEHEVDRVGHRRPEMYGPLCLPAKEIRVERPGSAG